MCISCSVVYKPLSPKQKYCEECQDTARKERQAELDRKRNRKIHNTAITRECLSCGNIFSTYYPKQRYCGSEQCEKFRLKLKSIKIDLRREPLIAAARKIEKYKRQGKKLKEIKKYVESRKYKLLEARKYKNTHDTKLLLECPEKHLWETTFHGFFQAKNNCLTCHLQNSNKSQPELDLLSFIKNKLPNIEVLHNSRAIIKPLELDIYVPTLKLAVEYCGLHWHGEASGKPRSYHYDKMMLCAEKGITLITIFEDDLYTKRSAVLSHLLKIMNNSDEVLLSKDCTVMEVDLNTALNFYAKNHHQSIRTINIALGLYHNKELVCVGSISSCNNGALDLNPVCASLNVSVVGEEKLLTAKFAALCSPKALRYTVDMRYGQAEIGIYEGLGFYLHSFYKHIPHYFSSQKCFLTSALSKNKTETLKLKRDEVRYKELGYDKIWDCGHRTYIYNL